MAKIPISDEELQLRKRARRRLVGAIVLVLLVVVLVPMFLEREPRSQKQDMDIRIPPIPGSAPERSGPNTMPASPPAMTPPQTGSPTSAELTGPPPAVSAPAPTTGDAVVPRSPPPETKTPASSKAPVAKAGTTDSLKSATEDGFVIQLGAYSNASNAKELLKQLKARKFPAYSESVDTPKGEKTRVRVGPYPSVEAADKARERLRALKLMPVRDAKVVRMGE
jgi:DedD protein